MQKLAEKFTFLLPLIPSLTTLAFGVSSTAEVRFVEHQSSEQPMISSLERPCQATFEGKLHPLCLRLLFCHVNACYLLLPLSLQFSELLSHSPWACAVQLESLLGGNPDCLPAGRVRTQTVLPRSRKFAHARLHPVSEHATLATQTLLNTFCFTSYLPSFPHATYLSPSWP